MLLPQPADVFRKSNSGTKRVLPKRLAPETPEQKYARLLAPRPYPEPPTLPNTPVIQDTQLFNPDARLSQVFGGNPDGVGLLNLQKKYAGQKAQTPAQGDYEGVKLAGQGAGAAAERKSLFPNGAQPVTPNPLSLNPLSARENVDYPNRVRPEEDVTGRILGILGGLIDPKNAGAFNAEPLRVASALAERTYEDKLRKYPTDVANANNKYEDTRQERNSQFDVAAKNEVNRMAAEQETFNRNKTLAQLTGEEAGAGAAQTALNPLINQQRTGAEGSAMTDLLNNYADLSLKSTMENNKASQDRFKNLLDLSEIGHKNAMKKFEDETHAINDQLDFLRPQFDPFMDLKGQLLRSQINKNNRPPAAADPRAMRLREINTAIRIASQGGNPADYGLDAMPGIMEAMQRKEQRQISALQMRDPATKKAYDEYMSVYRSFNERRNTYVNNLSTGLIEPGSAGDAKAIEENRKDAAIVDRYDQKVLEKINQIKLPKTPSPAQKVVTPPAGGGKKTPAKPDAYNFRAKTTPRPNPTAPAGLTSVVRKATGAKTTTKGGTARKLHYDLNTDSMR